MTAPTLVRLSDRLKILQEYRAVEIQKYQILYPHRNAESCA